MIQPSLTILAGMVRAADDYLALFGMPPAGVEPDVFIKSNYRNLAKGIHPDLFQDDDAKKLASDAFAHLGVLYDQAFEAHRLGQYGQPLQLAVVRTRKSEHRIIKQVATGDLSTGYYSETKTAGASTPTFCKVVKDPRDGDLMSAEARALRLFHGPDTETAWYPYVSELIETFLYAEAGKPRRQANVLVRMEGFSSMEEIRAKFPQGLSPLHAVWMWRRLLIALGFAHDNGVVHGAVLPRHVMILPEHHGLTLIDWCYASIQTDSKYPPLVAVVDDYRDWYPEEVMSKQAPSPATDIFMAARTMVYLMGGDPLTGTLPDAVPRQLRAFFRGCMQLKQSMRPQNAWLLFREFDELLEDIGGDYFPRTFREFVLP
jgi:hypothetical protein